WSDQRGMGGAASNVQFNLFSTAAPPSGTTIATAPAIPVPMLTSPLNGATFNLQSLQARPYIDVIFTKGTLTGIDGDELKLSGAGTANLDLTGGYITGRPAPTQLGPTTFRYYLATKPGATQPFVAGDVQVEFVAGSWQVQVGTGPVQQGGRGFASFN